MLVLGISCIVHREVPLDPRDLQAMPGANHGCLKGSGSMAVLVETHIAVGNGEVRRYVETFPAGLWPDLQGAFLFTLTDQMEEKDLETRKALEWAQEHAGSTEQHTHWLWHSGD